MIIKVGEKVIGEIKGEIFVKKVIGSKHRLQNPPAWAVDANAWDNQISPVCKYILIVDTEGQKNYWSTVDNFDKHKGLLDRGFDPQYFLALNRWSTEKPTAQPALILELPAPIMRYCQRCNVVTIQVRKKEDWYCTECSQSPVFS